MMIGLLRYVTSKYSLNHLKEKAKEHGIPHIGDKQALVERLLVVGAFKDDIVDYIKLTKADSDRYTPVTKKWAKSHLKHVRRAEIDPGIRDMIIELNEAGYYTTMSCSGLESDHPDDPCEFGYIDFIKTDRQKAKKLVDAARNANLIVDDRGTTIGADLDGRLFELDEIRVMMPVSKLAHQLSAAVTQTVPRRFPHRLSDNEIQQSWQQFRNRLLPSLDSGKQSLYNQNGR